MHVETQPPKPAEMRALAMNAIARVLGGPSLQVGGNGAQTYRCRSGAIIHLRTRFRDPQANGNFRYWFGLRDECWKAGEYFVLVCDRDLVLVVPVDEWLPHIDHFSVSKAGTANQSRQPHIIWDPSTDVAVLREGHLTLGVNQWRGRFDLLAAGGVGAD